MAIAKCGVLLDHSSLDYAIIVSGSSPVRVLRKIWRHIKTIDTNLNTYDHITNREMRRNGHTMVTHIHGVVHLCVARNQAIGVDDMANIRTRAAASNPYKCGARPMEVAMRFTGRLGHGFAPISQAAVRCKRRLYGRWVASKHWIYTAPCNDR
jgi:hypothetical protein